MKKYIYVFLLAALFSYSCKTTKTISKNQITDKNLLEKLMRQHPDQFESILKNRDSLKIQIIYTQIDRKKNNRPVFTDYYFNVDRTKYYYPASTVKMPVALLTLERLRKLMKKGVTKSSTMITEAEYNKQTPVYNDPTTSDGRPTIENYIKKILLVSDNDAFNRLYEFLGQQYINEKLHKKGYPDIDIIRRLALFANNEDDDRHTNPVRFFDENGNILLEQPMQFNSQPFRKRNDSIGIGYINNANQLVQHPMNFSSKNKLPLEDLHHILRSVLFPRSVKKSQRFRIKKEDYEFVWKYMSMYPPESDFPPYPRPEYFDAYGKFLYWGGTKDTLPKNFRSFSKEGDAYGFLIDAAYIVDFNRKIEFMLSAVIYCNSDGILNDDKYDYDSVGYPFMKNLGRLIYDYELKRNHLHLPDLSKFSMIHY